MAQEYRLPNINAPSLGGQMIQVHSYLRQLVEQMNQNLNAQEEAESARKEETQAEPFAPIRCYPVGSLYLSVSAVSPQALFGGRWERLKDRFLLAAGDTYLPGSLGGEAEVRLTEAQMPVHTHQVSRGSVTVIEGTERTIATLSGSGFQTTAPAGGGQAHNNLPPYLAVYVWKRVA